MSADDEKALWERFKVQGDAAARDALLIKHMRTVKYIAGRMAMHVPNNVEMDDLVGWGVLGLLDAVEKYDHTQDIKFSTYASIRVRGAILDEIRSLDWAPRSLRATARKLGAARDKLRHTHGREPRLDDLAAESGLTIDQVEETMTQLQAVQILSLDDFIPSEDADEARKLDLLSDERGATPVDAAEAQEKQEKLVEAIRQLPDQQQKVLHLYYYEELTLKEVGAVLEVSESRVCQIHSAAVKTLRKAVHGEA